MNTVPFRLPDVYAGLATCDGLLHDEGDHLCLEFQVKDAVVGVFGSTFTQRRIPLADISCVSLTDGWLGTDWGVKLVIETAKMELLQDVPGMTQGRVYLKIAKKDLHAAEAFVEELYRRHAPAPEQEQAG